MTSRASSGSSTISRSPVSFRAKRKATFVIFLPTKADIEWQTDSLRLDKIKECLGLNEYDLGINQNLKDELIKGLSKNRIDYLDLFNHMKARDEEFYWKKDYHLNDKGHKFIADKLYEKYNSLFRQLSLKLTN